VVSEAAEKDAPVAPAEKEKAADIKVKQGALGAGGISTTVKSSFAFEGSYRAMRNNEIKNYSLIALALDTALKAPSDAAINDSGDTLYVADSGARKILIFKKSGDAGFRLASQYDPVKPGFSGIFRKRISDGSTGPLFIALNKKENLLYVLDAEAGRIRVFNEKGSLVKEPVSGGVFKDASSIALSGGDDMMVTANPETNMIVTAGADGKIQAVYATTNGIGMGQLNRPCYAGFDSRNGYYVVDTLNGRVDRFDAAGRYVTNYRVGLLSRVQYPRLVVFDRGVKKPYFAVTQPETKKVFFYLLNEDAYRTVSLQETPGIKTENPSAMSVDAAGNMYILDTKTGVILKLSIPGDAMSEFIKMAPRR
jgi:DNA-binding beta-propeller fold protein YncE